MPVLSNVTARNKALKDMSYHYVTGSGGPLPVNFRTSQSRRNPVIAISIETMLQRECTVSRSNDADSSRFVELKAFIQQSRGAGGNPQ